MDYQTSDSGSDSDSPVFTAKSLNKRISPEKSQSPLHFMDSQPQPCLSTSPLPNSQPYEDTQVDEATQPQQGTQVEQGTEAQQGNEAQQGTQAQGNPTPLPAEHSDDKK